MLCALTRDMSNCCAGWGSKHRGNSRSNPLWSEALSIFNRSDERLDHLSADKVAVELVQLRQPEVIAGVVCVLGIVRVATQVTKELHQHERAVELLGV